MYFSFFFIHPVQTLPGEMPPGRKPGAKGGRLFRLAQIMARNPHSKYGCALETLILRKDI
jgi:hypothetical protein